MSIISYGHRRTDAELKAVYEAWLVKHGKAYNALGEKERRFEIFKDNVRFIEEHNAVNRSYKVGLNRFADLTNEEYRLTYLGRRDETPRGLRASRVSDRYSYRAGEDLPESVDWREKGAVVPVKDQGNCGEQFSFSFLIFLLPFLYAFCFYFLNRFPECG